VIDNVDNDAVSDGRFVDFADDDGVRRRVQ
jgi:hypothetical protein